MQTLSPEKEDDGVSQIRPCSAGRLALNRGMHLRSLAAAFLVLTGLSFAENPVPTLSNVPYGGHARQVLDFYQAKSDQPAPLLFFVHGGGWMTGDKVNPDFLSLCLSHGISVVSINYRLIPEAMEEKVEPPVRACLEDAATALQFVRSKATEWRIDKTRIAGCGGSAGGFTVLWLAFHPDMARPESANPLERESTRLKCVMAFVPQTSLDPEQMRRWIPNCDYGHHAFALSSFNDFLAKRESLLPWIADFSPFALASSDDPPVYLFYDSVPAPGTPHKDPPHSANFGAGLVERLRSVGIPYEFNYPGSPEVKHPNIFDFIAEQLKASPR